MAAYQKSVGTSVIRESDGAVITSADGDDFLAYQAWLSAGNVPDPEATNTPADAQALLDKSDITILRCVENGVTVPTAWATYRAALRQVVNGSSTTMPTQPAYPEGT